MGCLQPGRSTKIYAIIETGGKQHRVEPGTSLNVELLKADEGSTVELDRVLLASDGSKVLVGTPTVKGAKVMAKVNNHGRGKKIIVYRYKSKVRYSNKLGHRQPFTSLTVDKIDIPELKKKAAKKSTLAKEEESKDGA